MISFHDIIWTDTIYLNIPWLLDVQTCFYYFIITYKIAMKMIEHKSLCESAYLNFKNSICLIVFQKYYTSVYFYQNK